MSDDIAIKNLQAALAVAKSGLRVFPAKPVFNPKTGRWTKPPAVMGWQSVATTDPEQIIEWWVEFPDAIPAFPCDRLVVIDADRHGGPDDGVIALAALVNEHIYWPDHTTVLTPSGGEHHYFGQPSPPIGNGTGKLPKGIDVRGVGGFAICLDAVLPDGSGYQLDPSSLKAGTNWVEAHPPLPEWLETIIRADPIEAIGLHQCSKSATIQCRKSTIISHREQSFSEAALKAGVADVENAARGQRNSVLNSVAYRLGTMVGAGWIERNRVELNLMIAARGLEHDDGRTSVIKTIKSGLDAGGRRPHPALRDRKRGKK